MSLKDYYGILGLDSGESNQDTIKAAYKKATEEHHPKTYKGDDIIERLTDINEAFIMLSNVSCKALYDDALSESGDVDKGRLDEFINDSNSKAKGFVESYFNGTQKKKRGCSVGAIVCAFFLFIAAGGVISRVFFALVQTTPASVTEVQQFQAPSSWTQYTIENTFSLSIPPSLELRSDFDEFTQFIKRNCCAISNADVVFQQKDLSSMEQEALDTYCRILATRVYVGSETVLRYNESPKMTPEDILELRKIADMEIVPWSYISTPTYNWIDINGTRGIDTSYTRSGTKGTVVCHIYLFSNYDEIVEIVTAYRKVDEKKWKDDIDNVIRTYKWINPK